MRSHQRILEEGQLRSTTPTCCWSRWWPATPRALASRYAATENSVAGSLNMMTGWRTVKGVTVGQYVIDEPRRTVFFTASVDEGGTASGSGSLLMFRLLPNGFTNRDLRDSSH